MIKFKNVTKIFKSDLLTQPFVALDNVSFNVPQGSMVGFLGANGAGKTTSLKIIMDFIRPTSGEVEFNKEILGHNKMEVFKNIGFLPERPYFYPHLTGEEFVLFMGQISEVPKSKIKEEIKKWAPRFKIDHALKRELKTYSKGMLQRIGFMATIIHNPKLIILDEPLSGLDPIGRKELKDVIVEVHREGRTVFFSSHIVPDIEEICDRVIFLKDGKLVYDGSVNTLIRTGSDQAFTILLKGAENKKFEASIQKMVSLPDGLTRITLQAAEKDKFLLEALSLGCDIYGLEMIKPSLEEIFYNTQGSK